MSQIAVFLVTGIVFLIWFHRSYRNLRAYGAELPHGTGWAIGGWFVPVLNFFRPKSIANIIWKANDPELPIPVGASWEQVNVPAFVHFWWGMLVLSSLVSRYAASLIDDIESIEQAQEANLFVIIGDGLSAVAGILAILFVKGVQARQSARERTYDPSVALPT